MTAARVLPALLALTAVPAAPAAAQLTMQVGEGWNLSVAGNVNAFTVFTDARTVAPGPIDGGRVPVERITRIRTGLLPAVAVVDVKTREGSVDLGVHFGIGAEIGNASVHDNSDNGTQAGARIDMRQVYLTVGGGWGQLLAGRELSLFQRESILNDMTLFGTGASGGGIGAAGTTLGRSGFGYVYPNFNAQMTYSTPAARAYQMSIGIFDPDRIMGDFSPDGAAPTALPRLEGEATWHGQAGAVRFRTWAGGMYQSAEQQVRARGVDGGLRLDAGSVGLVASGYLARGVGSTYALSTNLGFDAALSARRSYGYIAQLTVRPAAGPLTVGASWGESRLDQTTYDVSIGNDALLCRNRALIGMALYQATKSLRLVGEYTRAEALAHSGARTRSDQVSTGLLLFF